jgi:hypothetical protein
MKTKPVSEENLFRKITQTRSLTVISWMIDKHLEEVDADCVTDEERITIRKIQGTNDLDMVWLFCHEHLGDEAEVKRIKEWLLTKNHRKQQKEKQ